MRFAVIVLVVSFATCLQANEPILLFNGKSLDGWETKAGQPVEQGWTVDNGELHLTTGKARGGNIFYKDPFADFELYFRWRIASRGNNGIKYRVKEYGGKTLGLEYQLFDDEGPKSLPRPKHQTGAIYDLYAPSPDRFLRPPGQYNDSRILVVGNYIEHWLNGQRIAAAIVGSPDWQRRVAASKFSDAKDFGQNRVGRIMITDHNSQVWFRHIALLPLSKVGTDYGPARSRRR